MKFKFWKLSGAGNDFVAFDNRSGSIPEQAKSQWARELCQRGHSIGADGILFIEPSANACFFMRIFMPDGSEAEACGNASRCIVLLAMELGIASSDLSFETPAGIYKAMVKGNLVKVSMTDPRDIRLNITVPDAAPSGLIHYIDAGVPHVVMFVEELEKLDIMGTGKLLRRHPLFQPRGTNVNFVKIQNPGNLQIRTYERGVENETLACGTGSVASAVIAGISGKAVSPVQIHTRGGMTNIVHFVLKDSQPKHVMLEGEARIVFRGEIELAV
ncbi:diaminopimelate epimerase [Candidatus Sumerlaeota bacterium]|nr:diaminopimelate epimerase [Candidatus Sumerlaeota bacterium]